MQVCPSTASAPCSTASPQLKLAKLLLKQWPNLSKEEFSRRAKALRASHQIQGPLALAWMFSQTARLCPPGPVRRYYLEQSDIATEDGVTMRKIQKGWKKLGDDPWSIVHPQNTMDTSVRE